jgi:hypothetical protein
MKKRYRFKKATLCVREVIKMQKFFIRCQGGSEGMEEREKE